MLNVIINVINVIFREKLIFSGLSTGKIQNVFLYYIGLLFTISDDLKVG